MDLTLSPRQRNFQQKIGDFARHAVAPVAAELDRKGSCPSETIDAFASHGLLGTCVSDEYGGSGEDYVAYVAALEEISRALASAGAIPSVHNPLVFEPLRRVG